VRVLKAAAGAEEGRSKISYVPAMQATSVCFKDIFGFYRGPGMTKWFSMVKCCREYASQADAW
jgi:hypothetical protein